MEVVTVAAKLTKKEHVLLEKLTKEYGFMSKSETIRNAVRLYLNLLSLGSEDRLMVLRLLNEIIAPSRMSSSELVEEVHREEDEAQ
ncbi:MAG: hypothetical protein ACE5PO_05215 [Candidatus Bathyarchaeia archaeon]